MLLSNVMGANLEFWKGKKGPSSHHHKGEGRGEREKERREEEKREKHTVHLWYVLPRQVIKSHMC